MKLSTEARLLEDMKAAMKAKDKDRLTTIRLTRAALQNRRIDKGSDLTDNEAIEIVSSEVKKRRQAVEEYRNLGRADVADGLEKEIKILMEYLPEQLSDEEVVSIVEGAVAQVGATGIDDLGKVMGAVMPKVKGRADGKKVNEIVRQILD